MVSSSSLVLKDDWLEGSPVQEVNDNDDENSSIQKHEDSDYYDDQDSSIQVSVSDGMQILQYVCSDVEGIS